MNKKLKHLLVYTQFLILLLINITSCIGSSFIPLERLFNVDQLAEVKTFSAQIEKEIEGLKKRKVQQEELYTFYKSELQKNQLKLDVLRGKSKEEKGSDLSFISKKLLILNQTVQTLTEIEQTNQQIINIISNNIKLLQEYKEDPEFKAKNLHLSSKSIYSIEDLQKLDDWKTQYATKIKEINEKLKKSCSDLEQKKRALVSAQQEYEEKRKEQKEFKNINLEDKEDREDREDKLKFTINQQAEILDIEENLLKYKKDLAQLRFQEVEQKRQLLETEIKTLKIQLEILNNEYDHIKSRLRIDDKDLKKSEEALKQQIQESSKKQEVLNKKIEELELIKAKKIDQVDQLRDKYKVSDAEMDMIKSWTLDPNSLNNWTELVLIGEISNEIFYDLNIKKDELLAQLDYEKNKINSKEIDQLIINTWSKITTGKFDSQEILKTIKNYEKLITDIQSNISSTVDKQSIANSELNSNSKIIDNIKSKLKELEEQKNSTFQEDLKLYNKLSTKLKEAYDEGLKRSEFIAHLIELYNSINLVRKDSVKKIESIIDELKTRLQWSGMPIFWKGLSSFIPDIKRFFRFIYEKDASNVLKLSQQKLSNLYNFYAKRPPELFYLLVELIIAIVIFLLLKLYLPDVIKLLRAISPKYGIGNSLSNFAIITIDFINKYLLAFFSWLLLFLSVKYKLGPDSLNNYFGIIFYLLSIPICLLFAYKYIKYLEKTNIENDYFLVSKQYQKRFLNVFSIFLYLTIIIVFFREAFLLSPLPKSDVPITLQALNFIILQIALICILSKGQILSLIHKTNAFSKWIYEQLEKYYYLFLTGLIFIIVMSNPYLGYGPQFFYIISRIILILLIIPFFLALHNKIKVGATSLFFSSEGDTTKERFPYARTSYGIFVIVSFLILIGLAVLLAANIWGYNIGFEKVYEWLSGEITSLNYIDEKGQKVSVNALDLGTVLLYVAAGIICAYLINKFVLGRIFDLLLVNAGIQNAITSLIRYTIIIVSIIIGLKSIGMSYILLYALAIIGGLGVAGKEIITDFIGYFIILIQRPIKIGDFIKVDPENSESVTGIVRHITLRSVVLRKKNSVTIIVPNSQVMTKSLVNWNYSRTYSAFSDILLTIPYNKDPEKAKQIILNVLDNNINILKNPAPIVWLSNFVDNGYQFLVRGYISFDKVLDQWHIASDIRLELVRVLKENGINIASPTRMLKIVDSADSQDLNHKT